MTTKREEGYYWITACGERLIAEWDGYFWVCCGDDSNIPETAVTDINEKRIIEEVIEKGLIEQLWKNNTADGI